jgi:hypothetical protein
VILSYISSLRIALSTLETVSQEVSIFSSRSRSNSTSILDAEIETKLE